MPSIAHLIHVYGLLVVAGVIGLENVGIPFPGETALIIASVISGTKHDLNIASVILTAAGASIIGRMIGYVIGRYVRGQKATFPGRSEHLELGRRSPY
jgi:membrane protein DedA with SNARE-associated domain